MNIRLNLQLDHIFHCFTEQSQVAILIHVRKTMHLPIKKKEGGIL